LQQQGLIERKPGAGSYVRSKVASESRTTLGILIPELGCGDIFDPIGAQIVRRAQAAGLGLIWGDAGNSQLHSRDALGRLDVLVDRVEDACATFTESKVAGVFYAPMRGNTPDEEIDKRILGILKGAGIEVVLIDRDIEVFPERSQYDLVSVDHLAGQMLAARHLINAGHKRIVYLQWPGKTDSLERRVAGQSRADSTVYRGDPREVEFVRGILKEAKPDAIMCENDMIAAHLLGTLAVLKVTVPEELSIVGFNDIAVAEHLAVPLTTVRQPCRAIGSLAVELMMSRLKKPNLPGRTLSLSSEFVLRKSTLARSERS
jgi:GntR family transcriptional regulator, arabinose operon transcriptional repressor